MLPTLKEGDLIIFKPFLYKKDILLEGILVVINHPLKADTLMVKRISKVGASYVEVLGDNETISIDSRKFGPINQTEIQGIVERIITKRQFNLFQKI